MPEEHDALKRAAQATYDDYLIVEKIEPTERPDRIVEGSLELPDGGSVKVRTVWISEQDGDPPRFVTAYPV